MRLLQNWQNEKRLERELQRKETTADIELDEDTRYLLVTLKNDIRESSSSKVDICKSNHQNYKNSEPYAHNLAFPPSYM